MYSGISVINGLAAAGACQSLRATRKMQQELAVAACSAATWLFTKTSHRQCAVCRRQSRNCRQRDKPASLQSGNAFVCCMKNIILRDTELYPLLFFLSRLFHQFTLHNDTCKASAIARKNKQPADFFAVFCILSGTWGSAQARSLHGIRSAMCQSFA